MGPLNGRCAMTRDERNARRRELDADPFHLSLTHKVKKAWRERNRERVNAERRGKYAANAERERTRAKAWRDANPEKRKAAWKRWADANRDYLRERDAKRSATAAEKARRAAYVAARRERMASDPEYRKRVNAQKRDAYHRGKGGSKFLRWYLKCLLVPRWRRIDGEEDERKYLARCNDRTRRLYMLWKRDAYGALRRLVGEDAP